MRKIVEAAITFAKRAYGTGDERLKHCEAVAGLVEQTGGKLETSASWLCAIKDATAIAEIGEMFRKEFGKTPGDLITTILADLADLRDLPGLTKLEEKSIHAIRLEAKGDSVRMIALAIEIVNLKNIAENPPATWNDRVFLDYAWGSTLVARVCRGVSPFLGNEFDAAHKNVVDAHF
jgi:hypothetical protein